MRATVIEEEGWLFDYFPRGQEMVFWFLIQGGEERLRLVQPYSPKGYVEGKDPARIESLRRAMERTRSFRMGGTVPKPDFWTGHDVEMHEVQILDLEQAYQELQLLYQKFPEISYYDCDIPFEQFYGYTQDLFPTARCCLVHDGETLLSCTALEKPWSTDYAPIPVRAATLHGEGSLGARTAMLRSLALEMNGRSMEWNVEDPVEAFHSFNQTLEEWDPDLILTRGGDSLLMPCLFQISSLTGIPLRLDREGGIIRRLQNRGQSYVSYGRIVYRDPDYPLWGRWHIDLRNSFLAFESDLDGLIEAARVSRLPVQRMARRSIGTGISSVQIAYVSRKGYPIPWKKTRPEDWKTALQLLRSDRGGLTYTPRPGVYENVVELDFVSMYPSIMTHFNVSPETINCPCCPESTHHVPELGYRICEKREGMISSSLIPILEKRIEYKRRMLAATDPVERTRYKNRQAALKWLLVCCFGYLGYKNARFGRIEAHESICAFSREMLLRTRHLCEEWGFRVLNSLVDCVWLQKMGQTHAEVHALCREIEEVTDLPISIEGHYSWLVVLSSTRHPELPIPARYFGRFEDGSLKFRGIEIRRGDQAPFVQEVQGKLLHMLGTAETVEGCRALKESLLAVVAEAEEALRERHVPMGDLLLKRRLSRTAEEYRSNAMTATAARQAARIGRNMAGGQDVYFAVVDSRSGNPDERIRLVDYLKPETRYDVDFYLEQLNRAVRTVLVPFLGTGESAPRYEAFQQMMFEV